MIKCFQLKQAVCKFEPIYTKFSYLNQLIILYLIVLDKTLKSIREVQLDNRKVLSLDQIF